MPLLKPTDCGACQCKTCFKRSQCQYIDCRPCIMAGKPYHTELCKYYEEHEKQMDIFEYMKGAEK